MVNKELKSLAKIIKKNSVNSKTTCFNLNHLNNFYSYL
jgi:hypothetical protein